MGRICLVQEKEKEPAVMVCHAMDLLATQTPWISLYGAFVARHPKTNCKLFASFGFIFLIDVFLYMLSCLFSAQTKHTLSRTITSLFQKLKKIELRQSSLISDDIIFL